MKLLQAFVLAIAFASAATAAVLTNTDIVKMTAAKLDQGIIVTAIQNSDTKFDVSAQGLIDLTSAGVPEPVIAAMLKRANTPAAAPAATTAGNAGPSTAGATSDHFSPSEVLFVDGDKTTAMRYLTPQMRSAARGLGFGGFAQYAVLRGTAASFETSNPEPAFIVSVPNQAQPESYVTVASFAVRRNGSREVMIGGGYMSYSTGIHPDRIVKVTTEKMADQSRAEKGFTIYRVTPTHPLPAGQYAVILYTGEMQSLVSAWFAGGGNAYFDFGVEPRRG